MRLIMQSLVRRLRACVPSCASSLACLLVAAAGCGGSTEQSAPAARGPLRLRRRAAAVRRSGPRERALPDRDPRRVLHRGPRSDRRVPRAAAEERRARPGGDLPARLGRRSHAVRGARDVARRAARDRARDHCSVGHGAGSGEHLARRQAPSAGSARGARRGRRPAGDRPASPAAGRRPEPDRLRGLERRCPLRGDPGGRRATAAHPGPDVGRIHAGLGLCRTRAGFVALDGSPLPDDRRPAPLRRTRNRVRAAPAGRTARPGGAAVSARSNGHCGAQRDDPALVRRGSRAECEGVPRPAGLARTEASARLAARERRPHRS